MLAGRLVPHPSGTLRLPHSKQPLVFISFSLQADATRCQIIWRPMGCPPPVHTLTRSAVTTEPTHVSRCFGIPASISMFLDSLKACPPPPRPRCRVPRAEAPGLPIVPVTPSSPHLPGLPQQHGPGGRSQAPRAVPPAVQSAVPVVPCGPHVLRRRRVLGRTRGWRWRCRGGWWQEVRGDPPGALGAPRSDLQRGCRRAGSAQPGCPLGQGCCSRHRLLPGLMLQLVFISGFAVWKCGDVYG